tara:strand:+ start:48 stop:587 length:540 start_codon:yes stop_codon:yes gene_type:complete
MRKNLISIFILIILFSCKEKSKQDLVKSQMTLTAERDSIKERFFPKNKIDYQKDTLIENLDLKISVTEKSLNTYVIDTFTSEGVKYIDKYRDTEFLLLIQKGKLKILDTSFKKDNFIDLAGKELIEYGNFTTYQLNNISESEIEFFGVINEPETDWSFPFYHKYDLKKNEFEIKEIDQN